MASYTDNLNLLKKNPLTDGNDTFNIQTMLNENWDKIDEAIGDAAAQAQKMGLTGDLSIGASLNVLANIGNVHVWERVQTYADPVPEVPAGYTLGAVQTGQFQMASYNSNNSESARGVANYYVWNDLKLIGDGTPDVSLATVKSSNGRDFINSDSFDNKFRGKFIKFKEITGYNCTVSDALKEGVWYIPTDVKVTGSANADNDPNMYRTYIDKIQSVNTYPYTPAIPAGTHVDYLTSTDPNAYPKQSDRAYVEKKESITDEANLLVSGYTNSSDYATYNVADSISIDSSGNVSLVSPTTVKIYTNGSKVVNSDLLKGKYVSLKTTGGGGRVGSPFNSGGIYFIPSDADISVSYVSSYYSKITSGFYSVSAEYVTSISITYLGQLGEPGARIEVGSYVGTGTYGSSNPNTLMFGFEPKIVFIEGSGYHTDGVAFIQNGQEELNITELFYFTEISWDGKTVSWYGSYSGYQANESNWTYHYIAIG